MNTQDYHLLAITLFKITHPQHVVTDKKILRVKPFANN